MRLHRLALLTLSLLTAATARAQPVPGTVAGENLVIGASSPSDLNTSAVATIFGLPARTAGQELLGVNATGREVVKGLLGTADIPSVFTRRDVAEVIPQPWRWSMTSPYVDFHETDAGTDRKFWRWISEAGIHRLQAVNDAYSVAADAITFNRSGGTPSLFTSNIPIDVNGSAGASVSISALGMNRLSFGINTGTPRIVFENLGYQLWEIDNATGILRFIRTDSSGVADSVPLQISDNVIFQPYGKRVLPGTLYGVDIGSQQLKFGAGWFGELIADTLVSIENIGTIDNRWLIGSGNILDADLSPSAMTMITRYNNLAAGHYVYFQKFGKTEFVKVSAYGGLYNGVQTNASFESGTVTNWHVSVSDTVANSTTKSFHGERSMFVDANGSGGLQVAYAGFSSAASTTYTACAFFRRADAGVIAPGDITVNSRGGTAVALTSEPTGTDVWYRGCATFTSGVDADARAPFWNFIIETDYYIDAVQIEGDAVVRPFSETRASYTITRHEDGIGVANQWYAGDGMFSTGGAAGYGWIDCYAFQGIKSATEQGPACAANVRTGTSVFDWSPYAAWGNLNGIYGYGVSTFGMAGGRHGDDYFTVESTNGIRMFTAGVIRAQFYPTGEIGLGGQVAGDPHLVIRPTNLQFCIYGGACSITMNGTTGSIDMTGSLTVGTAGAIMSGATAYDTGTGYWLAYNGGTPQMRIGTPSGAASPSYLRWTGSSLELRSDRFTITSSGVSINTGGGLGCQSTLGGYYFGFGDATLNGIYACESSGIRDVVIQSQKAGQAIVEINAINNSLSSTAALQLQADIGATPSFFKVIADDFFINGLQGLTTTISVSCGVLTFSDGILTNKGTC